MNRIFRAILTSVLGIIMLGISIPFITVSSKASELYSVNIDVQYGQTEARQMLDYINQFRAGNDVDGQPAAYLNEDNETTTNLTGQLEPLTYDYALERIAMQRAAEVAMNFSHTRPDGSDCFTAWGETWSGKGENIALGTTTAYDTFVAWREDDKDYAGQGHRRNMLDPSLERIGIGHVTFNGVDYWAQAFGTGIGDDQETDAMDGDSTASVDVLPDNIQNLTVNASPESVLLSADQSTELPIAEVTLKLTETYPEEVFTVSVRPEWTINDSSVAIIENDAVIGAGEGETSLTAEVFGTVLTVPVSVQTDSEKETAEGFKYQILNDQAVITGYTGNNAVIVIPSEIEGYPVVEIGYSAFMQNNILTSVTIPEGVTTINSMAFYWCPNLSEVNLSDTVTTIADSAFASCMNIKELVLPAGVTYIAGNAFMSNGFYNGGLETISVDPDNMVYDSRDNCNAVIETETNMLVMGCNNTTIPSSVTSIGPEAFRYCVYLQDLTIPDGTTSIMDSAFMYCPSMSHVTIPATVSNIGAGAFSNSNLATVSLPASLTEVSEYMFSSCVNLTAVFIPSGITEIKDYAFENCYGLKYIYYQGTEDEWNQISIGEGNDYLRQAEIILSADGIELPLASLEVPDISIVENTHGELIESETGCFYQYNEAGILNSDEVQLTVVYNGDTYQGSLAEIKNQINVSDEIIPADAFIWVYDTNREESPWLVNNTYQATAYLLGQTCNFNVTIIDEEEIIEPEIYDLSNATVTGLHDVTYTGKAQVVNPVVTLDGKELVQDTDYSLQFSNNINAGIAEVTITGIGNYTGTIIESFAIKPIAQVVSVKASASSVSVGKTATLTVTGAKGTKSYKSSDAGIATVSSSGKITAKKVGTVKITVTSAATTNYTKATKTITIKVLPAATTSVTASNQATGFKVTWKKVAGATGYYVYRNGTLIKKVTSGSTVSYADSKANTNGTKYVYKIIAFAGTGKSTLSKSVTAYRLSRPTITSLTNQTPNRMTVKWGKNAKGSGYQIQYSLSKSFASGIKLVTVSDASKLSRVVSGLSDGKTYYVRVRSFKTVGSTKYYSSWSSTKSVKMKVCSFLLNTSTHKFHYSSCGSGQKTKASNRQTFIGTREELIKKGYSPCGNCKP